MLTKSTDSIPFCYVASVAYDTKLNDKLLHIWLHVRQDEPRHALLEKTLKTVFKEFMGYLGQSKNHKELDVQELAKNV